MLISFKLPVSRLIVSLSTEISSLLVMSTPTNMDSMFCKCCSDHWKDVVLEFGLDLGQTGHHWPATHVKSQVCGCAFQIDSTVVS